MTWTLARAKNHLSDVIRQAIDQGPQSISIDGHEAAVVVSKVDFDLYRDLADGRSNFGGVAEPSNDFKAFLLSIPSLDGVDLTRNQTPARDLDI